MGQKHFPPRRKKIFVLGQVPTFVPASKSEKKRTVLQFEPLDGQNTAEFLQTPPTDEKNAKHLNMQKYLYLMEWKIRETEASNFARRAYPLY